MIVESVLVGPMAVNCYVVVCPETQKAMIIDPGAEYHKIKGIVETLKVKPVFIVNTHGHIDHIGANHRFKIPIYIHSSDADFLTDPEKNLSAAYAIPATFGKPARLLEDGDVIEVGTLKFKVLHTPGHTPGGISLYADDVVFTGDTLFCGGIGRYDFPGSSGNDLMHSIKEKLLKLPENTKVYPGHGDFSTIGQEKTSNPFL